MSIESILNAIYSPKEIAAASGLGEVLIQQYSNRGLLQFESVDAGGRTFRRFSLVEVFAAATISVLRNMGAVPNAVAVAARQAAGQWLSIREEPELFSHLKGARFAVFPESMTPHFSQTNSPMGSAVDWKNEDAIYLSESRPVFGDPRGFQVVDMERLGQDVMARLGSFEERGD